VAKYSIKRIDFIRFYLYLCHAVDELQLLSFVAPNYMKLLACQNPEPHFMA
jgi:hypothetical protein